MKMNAVVIAALLLLVGGLVNAVPPLGKGLMDLFGGSPVAQVIIGALSIIMGLVLFVRKGIAS